MTSSPLPPAARTAGRVFLWILVLGVVLVIAGAAWITVRGGTAYLHLSAAQETADGAAEALRDPAQAAELIADLSVDTSAARELTSDPVWNAAESLPWVGPQLTAVGTVAAALDDVASTALTPLADAAAQFSVDDLRPVDGRIDTSVFTAIAPAAQTGADGMRAAASAVAGIDRSALLGPVADAVGQVSGLLGTATDTADALARATVLLPSMLGADGERDYLVVFQNNAEWRSLGGIVGAMVVIHTDDGAMTLAAQGSSSDFRRFDPAVDGLTDDEEALFGTRPARFVQNVTQVPDFSVSAQLAQNMWAQEMDQDVDGVLSLDPVALSYLLEATGPVTLSTGDTLTADNAVQLLLNDVYLRYENPADQDAFFAEASAAVFTALSNGSVDPGTLVTALGRAGTERRLMLWSSVPEEAAELDETTLVGPLPFTDADRLGLGVFLNDGTGSKMDYYMTPETTVAWGECSLDAAGRATGDVTLTVTVTNDAPEDAASLPDYITGDGVYDVPPGHAKTVGYVYLPVGAELRDATMSDESGFGGGFDQGRQVLTFSSELAPGESATATVTVRATTPGAAQALAWVTPTADADLPTEVGDSCSGS